MPIFNRATTCECNTLDQVVRGEWVFLYEIGCCLSKRLNRAVGEVITPLFLRPHNPRMRVGGGVFMFIRRLKINALRYFFQVQVNRQEY